MLNQQELNKNINDLLEEAELLKKCLNKFSDNINNIEKNLISKKINFPFKLLIEKDVYFSWEYVEKCDSFRLLYIEMDKEIERYKRPFIETPINIRLKYFQFLMQFLKEFKINLTNKVEEIVWCMKHHQMDGQLYDDDLPY